MFGLDSIGDALSDVTDLVSDIANGDIAGALDNVADLAQAAAPIVSMINPAAGMALGAGGSLLDKVIADGVQSDVIRRGKEQVKADGSTGGGEIEGDIFAQLAAIVGEQMTKGIENLRDQAKALDGAKASDGSNALDLAAQFTGEQEKLKFLSTSLGNLLPTIGTASTNVARTS
jgi:hypothetical protein